MRMRRKRFRIIMMLLATVVTLVAIACAGMYFMYNKEYYMDLIKNYNTNLYKVINNGVLASLCVIMLFYSIIRLIISGILDDKEYIRRTREKSFGVISVYIILWIVLIGYLGFATVTISLPLTTFPLLVAVALNMVVTIVFYLDVLMPNYIKDKC